MEDKTTYGISVIIKTTGMRRKDILAHMGTGKITAQIRGKQFAFDISEKNRLESLHNTYVGFFNLARGYVEGKSGFSLEKKRCRNELIDFASENSWFGAGILPVDEVFFADTGNELFFVRKADEHKIATGLRLWFASYGESAENKLRLLLGRIREFYPATGNLLSKFFTEEYPDNCTAAWILTDFLCSALHSEITQADDGVLDCLAKSMDEELPLNSARMFSAFLIYLRDKRKLKNGWSYRFTQRSESKDKSAYSAHAYFTMAYIVFNEDAWEAEQLKEKALSSEVYANLWLFVAFHFICGWRGSDIVRIPMPGLPCAGEVMRKQLSAGSFDTNSLVEETEMRLRLAPMKPNKTAGFDVPELKMSVAESLRKPFGFIFSAAASYHDNTLPGGTFVRRAGNIAELQDFFGTKFISACEYRGFSTRRANKSYLQGIESAATNTPGKPKGYMLAALARSHKSGYASLPRTTEIYLRDARFSGYSPEFIAREMFERGVFSFIPALLLDIYEGKHYEKMSVPAQTTLMAEIGIAPSGLEGLAYAVQRTLAKARRAVAAIMENTLEMRYSVEIILQNIASGCAPGRQDGFLCLMTAAGFVCANPDRSCCIGCGFEIYTKTILRLLINEYSRLRERKMTAGKSEAARCEAILKNAVMPAISEMLYSAERLYPDADIKPLLLEIERGLRSC
jgi:hypothetical protein